MDSYCVRQMFCSAELSLTLQAEQPMSLYYRKYHTCLGSTVNVFQKQYRFRTVEAIGNEVITVTPSNTLCTWVVYLSHIDQALFNIYYFIMP